MSSAALVLVLTAAVLHATWNVLAKRAQPASTFSFVWLCTALAAAIYVPLVAALVVIAPLRHGLTPIDLAFVGGTALIHTAYFLLLQRGYRAGDLSLVYPLARGTGPLLAAVAAILMLGERPGVLGTLGIVAIVGGIFLATGATLRVAHARASIGYGLATGATIAAYTLWDKHAVSALALSPIVYDVGRTVVQTAIMAPFVATGEGRASLAATWTACRREIVGVAVLSPLAYMLVLFALVSAPVSVIAPAREISIVLGAVLGARLLGEAYGARRVAAATIMVAGIVALARS